MRQGCSTKARRGAQPSGLRAGTPEPTSTLWSLTGFKRRLAQAWRRFRREGRSTGRLKRCSGCGRGSWRARRRRCR
eukprot:3425902-Rhodomonas_salina.2